MIHLRPALKSDATFLAELEAEPAIAAHRDAYEE